MVQLERGTAIMRVTFEPGWRWSECVKPLGSGVPIVPKTSVLHLSHTNGFVMENATALASATFGWHSHRTAVVVAVTAGTLTLRANPNNLDVNQSRPRRCPTSLQ